VCSTRLCEVPRSARDDTGVFLRQISRPSMNAKEHTFTLSIEEEFAIVDNSLFYERTALSRNKAKMLSRGSVAKPEDAATAEEKIKDPYVLEFLGLKDEYSEADIEETLILHLERFLLELGGDFTFVGRQRRLRIGDEWYRIDLLFFHRKLRCLVVIDLTRGKFTHADAGQMHMYLNYAREHWTRAGENPPVGLNSLQPRLPAKKIATTMGRATSR
jgi:predicted nuclease of restriction endonuclease-like (RecB) superfamily